MRDDFKSPKYQKLTNDLVLLGVLLSSVRKRKSEFQIGFESTTPGSNPIWNSDFFVFRVDVI